MYTVQARIYTLHSHTLGQKRSNRRPEGRRRRLSPLDGIPTDPQATWYISQDWERLEPLIADMLLTFVKNTGGIVNKSKHLRVPSSSYLDLYRVATYKEVALPIPGDI